MPRTAELLLVGSQPDVVRVLLAGPLFGLRGALAGEPRLRLVGHAATLDAVLDLARRRQPSVVLMDAAMATGGEDGLLRRLRREAPDSMAVTLTGESDDALEAILAGARGTVDHRASVVRIVEAIERVACGELVLDGASGGGVLDRVREQLQEQTREARRVADITALVDSAIDGDGLAMVFQPIIDLLTRDLLGYEALSRFSLDPPQTPDRVFAAAATIGRGADLELAAVRRGLAALPQIPRDCYLALNVSPATLLLPALAELLATVDDVGRIVLEITENAPVEDYDAVADALRPFRARGARLAIDDTGAGFASLRHILRLEPDIIKLDRSITERIDSDRPTRALAAALSLVALESGMSIVAEGIETESQLAILDAIGVTCGQGYLLGRPGPLAP